MLALRFGWTRFVDNSTMTIDFDPATLGFSSTFLGQVGADRRAEVPAGSTFTNGYSGFGAINPSYRTYKSSGANGSYSKFVGTHTFKMGADYRQIGVYLLNPGNASGELPVRQGVHLVHRPQPEQHDRRRRVRELPARVSDAPTARGRAR